LTKLLPNVKGGGVFFAEQGTRGTSNDLYRRERAERASEQAQPGNGMNGHHPTTNNERQRRMSEPRYTWDTLGKKSTKTRITSELDVRQIKPTSDWNSRVKRDWKWSTISLPLTTRRFEWKWYHNSPGRTTLYGL